jgi:hypothetical protein
MGSFIATVILFAALFFVSFITKRRFGMLGLALSAGALLSIHWAGTLTPWLEGQGIRLVTPPLSAMVQIILVLTPATFLLFNGPTHNKMIPRVAGSLAFAVLAMVYMTDILANILVLNGPSASLFQFLHDNKSLFVVGGIVASVTDILMTRKPKPSKEGKKGSH